VTGGKKVKKTKVFVMTLAIALCTAAPAYAYLPFKSENGCIVIGNKAYSISYLTSLNSPSDIRAINDRIIKYANNMYYVNSLDNVNERIVNITNLNGVSTTEANLSYLFGNTISYQSVNGQKTYIYDNTTLQYKDQASNSYAYAYVNVQNITSVYMADIRVDASSISGLTGVTPAYYKLEHSSSIVPLGTDINCMLKNTTGTERVYLLSSNKETIATGNIDISPTSGYVYRKFYLDLQQSSDSTNTDHNISNNGYAAQDSLWIYYSNTADGGKLYKVKKDGQDNQPLSNDQAVFINVSGSVIYYSNLSDGSKIYRINTDGTGRTKVCDDMASYVFLSGSSLYYSNHSKGGSLSKIDIQSKGGTGTVLSSDDAAYINVSGDTIYYSNNSDGKKIYSIGTDGMCRTCISTDGAKYINLLNDYIIYGNYSHGGSIYKIKTDGTEDAQVGNGSLVGAINVYGKDDSSSMIYFSNLSDGGKLYKMNVDGSSVTGPLIKDSVDSINITDNGIYYTKSNKLSLASPLGGSTMTISQVTKPQLPDKIQTLNNVTDTVAKESDIANYQFPDRVPAIMNTGVTKEIVVNWDYSKYVKKNNIYTYTGTLLGYGNKVTLTLTVTASTPVDPSNVTITNNHDNNYKIVVKGLSAGDTIKIYSNQTADTPLDGTNGIVIVGTNSTTATTNITIPQSLTNVSISLTKATTSGAPTPSESARIDVALPVLTTAKFTATDATPTNNIGANDTIAISNANIPIGDTFKIYRAGETTPIKSLISTLSGGITFDSLDLGAKGGNFDITETASGKSESARVTISVGPSQNQTDVTKAIDYVKAEFEKDCKVSPISGVYTLKDNFTLPSVLLPSDYSELLGDVTVTWKSGNSSLISIIGNNAIIYRPKTGQNLILYATLSEGDAKTDADVQFNITDPAITADEAVGIDKDLITIGYANTGDSASNVTGNLILPTKGQNGSTITWSAALATGYGSRTNPVDTTSTSTTGIGVITQPEKGTGDVKVDLHATVSRSDTTTTADINPITITVKQKSATQDDLTTALSLIPDTTIDTPFVIKYGDNAFNTLNFSQIKSMGIGISLQSSDQNTLRLGSNESGDANSAIIINAPTYSQGAEIVTLNATVTKNGSSASKTIIVKVMNKPATEIELANAISDSLSAYLITKGNTNPSVSNPLNELYLPESSNDSYNDGSTTYNFKVSPLDSQDVSYVHSGDEMVLSIQWTSPDIPAISSTPATLNYLDVSSVASGNTVTLVGSIMGSDGKMIINKIIKVKIVH
jgi:hypothetical protein